MKITVSCNGIYIDAAAAVEIPELLQKQWRPLKTCDSPILCLATGERHPGSEYVSTAMALRTDAAKIISEALTEKLLELMAEKDTHNGYSKSEKRLENAITYGTSHPEMYIANQPDKC